MQNQASLCGRQHNPHPENHTGAPNLWIVAPWQLSAPLSHHTCPSPIPSFLSGFELDLFPGQVTELRTGWASTGRILVHGRESWIIGRQSCAQGRPKGSAAQVGDGPSLPSLFPWENPSQQGWSLCLWNSWRAEAYLYIKQGPVGVYQAELSP